jgi:hypothetical protein
MLDRIISPDQRLICDSIYKMKISSKKYNLTAALLITSIAVYSFFHMFKKEMSIIGFAYENDIIRVKQSNVTLEILSLDKNNIDSNRICSFYENFSYYTFNGRANLNIEIDSAHYKLLDTVLVFTEKNKKPFISFEKPTETKFKRKFFVGDKTNKYYMEF